MPVAKITTFYLPPQSLDSTYLPIIQSLKFAVEVNKYDGNFTYITMQIWLL